MLKKIFGSGTRVKLFRQFLMNPQDEFFIRELTRILDEQINSLRRELQNLEAIGMLRSRDRNRKKYYQINPHFLLLHEVTNLVRKTNPSGQMLLKKLSKLGVVDLLILTGTFIKQEGGNVDIFIVGQIEKEDLEKFIEENFPEKNLKYVLMSREDFLYRLTLKDNFVNSIFKNKDNLILKNKIKKYTEHMLS